MEGACEDVIERVPKIKWVKIKKWRLHRMLLSSEHFLLLQRTRVQGLAPTHSGSQPTATLVPGDLTPSPSSMLACRYGAHTEKQELTH